MESPGELQRGGSSDLTRPKYGETKAFKNWRRPILLAPVGVVGGSGHVPI